MALTGDSFGVVQGFALLDIGTGKMTKFSDLGAGTPGPKGEKGDTGPQGPAGPKGDAGAAGTAGAAGRGIKTISASVSGTTVTLTFEMSDSTQETVSYNIASTGG